MSDVTRWASNRAELDDPPASRSSKALMKEVNTRQLKMFCPLPS